MESGNILRSVVAVRERTRNALSPWIRRRLGAKTAAPASRRSLTLTTSNVRSLLNRAQRRTERARVWTPDVGTLKPASVQRFNRAVAGRLQAPSLVSVRRAQATSAAYHLLPHPR